MRKKLELNMTTEEFVITLSEGIPGAINVLLHLLRSPRGMFAILHLDDMNIRGFQIWVAYKDYCNEDVDEFIDAIFKRDPAMVDAVNRECYHPHLGAQYAEKAVTSGASYGRVSV